MVSSPRHSFTRKPNLADLKAAGHDMLRLVNRRILLSILSDRQPISRAEIAKLSGQIAEGRLQISSVDQIKHSDAQRDLREAEARIAELADVAIEVRLHLPALDDHPRFGPVTVLEPGTQKIAFWRAPVVLVP